MAATHTHRGGPKAKRSGESRRRWYVTVDGVTQEHLGAFATRAEAVREGERVRKLHGFRAGQVGAVSSAASGKRRSPFGVKPKRVAKPKPRGLFA